MLDQKEVVATIAVQDLKKARKFYEEALGLKAVEELGDMVVTYKSGTSKLLVYKSEFAGGYKATVVTWKMEDGIEAIARTLKEKGVVFEHYDMPGTKMDGDIHVFGDMKNVWFKDPDGNILCLVQSPKNA